MAFDLTVLGSAGSHTGAGRACSGYLLQSGGSRIVVDAGNGSTSNLQRYVAVEDVDAIVVTHKHVDHCVDLIGMYYALRFHADGPRSVDLYAAPEVVDNLVALLSEDSAFEFREAFRCHEVRGGDHLSLGGFEVDVFDANHTVPTVSLRVAAEGRVLTYSSDTAGDDVLVEAAAGADLFLCEATWQGEPADVPPGIHLTASEAGRVAGRAGVDRLLLTHILPTLDRDVTLEQASATWDGWLSLADDNQSWSLT
ncbi:MAG: MBL fold metallo-hydrolase [Actinomycetes bacterium]